MVAKIKMPKNKVLTLYQKAKICEMSLKPGFDKEQCEKEFGIQRSCINNYITNYNVKFVIKYLEKLVILHFIYVNTYIYVIAYLEVDL